MQGELNVVWDKLLPALHSMPLPENPGEYAKLQQMADHLTASK